MNYELKAKDNLTKTILIRLSEKDKAKLQSLADKDSRDLAAYARLHLLKLLK